MSYNKLAVAIEVLTYVAMNSGEHPASSKIICKELGLKLRYTETLMQAFVKAGILKSIRGVAGGYSLGRDRRRIDLAEVNEIVISLQNSINKKPDNSTLSMVSGSIISDIENSITQTLQKITLEEIYDKAVKLKMTDGKTKKTDFVI